MSLRPTYVRQLRIFDSRIDPSRREMQVKVALPVPQ
jgi:hypothetical protein